jgi:hypothetical protein
VFNRPDCGSYRHIGWTQAPIIFWTTRNSLLLCSFLLGVVTVTKPVVAPTR